MTPTPTSQPVERTVPARRLPLGRTLGVGVVGAIVLGVTLLVALPLGYLAEVSVDGPNGPTGEFYRALTSSGMRDTLVNTAAVAGGGTLIAVALALPLAWSVARIDFPGRRFFRIAAFLGLVMPSFALALGYTMLAGPQAGALNKLLRSALGSGSLDGPIDIYSLGGIVFVCSLELFPLAFLYLYAAFEVSGRDGEDAARMLGARPLTVFRTVTLRQITPALLGATILTFAEGVSLFGIPFILGYSQGTHVLSTEIWAQMGGFPPNFSAAAALAMPLVLVAAALFLLRARVIRSRDYTRIVGRGSQAVVQPATRLVRWSWTAAHTVIVGLAIVLPLGILVVAAFTKAWGAPLGGDNFTWDNFQFVLQGYGPGKDAFRNTVMICGLGATIALLSAGVVAYCRHQGALETPVRIATLVITGIAAVPAIVLGLGMFKAFVGEPWALYGTFTLVVLAFTVKLLPTALVNLDGAFRSLDRTVEDAARTFGASQMRTIRDVGIPLLSPAIASVWLILFMVATRELSLVVFITTGKTEVVASLIFSLYTYGALPAASAYTVALTAIGFAAASAAFYMLARRGSLLL